MVSASWIQEHYPDCTKKHNKGAGLEQINN